MAASDAVKLERERRKTLRETQTMNIVNGLVRSPIVQLVGTVALAEYLESQHILSDRWAGALEGGVITMVGLQALKEFGTVGAAGLALGMGSGAIQGSDTPSWWKALAAGIPPLELLTLGGVSP